MASSQEATQNCTQAVDDCLEFDESAVDPQNNVTDEPRTWGQLVTRGGDIRELCEKEGEVGENGQQLEEFHEYLLGRASNVCDIVASKDNRVSGKHCRIFCKVDTRAPTASSTGSGRPDAYAVYVENLSGNGTFVNSHKLAVKGERRRLNNGDEVALLFPKGGFPVETLKETTFTFVNLLERDQQALSMSATAAAAMAANGAPNDDDDEEDSAPRLEGAFTAALHNPRAIRDFYILGEELGKGQFGVVYKATNKETGEPWAVKELDTRRALLSGSEVDSMVNEVRLLRDLHHPGIIAAAEVFRDAGHLYFVMELVEGGDLFDRIVNRHTKGYPEQLAKQLMRNVIEAVRFLHSKNIIHRDLKPENILLVNNVSDVDIKLTDFGLAKKGDVAKTFCGTPQYFAPEVLQRQNTVDGTGQYGKPADMWSVGVITYVVLSGTPAFSSSKVEEQISTATYNPMTGRRWARHSDAAKEFVRRLLVVSETDRLSAEQALGNDWLIEGIVTQPVDDSAGAAAAAEPPNKKG